LLNVLTTMKFIITVSELWVLKCCRLAVLAYDSSWSRVPVYGVAGVVSSLLRACIDSTESFVQIEQVKLT
jgi:hypothetical protein